MSKYSVVFWAAVLCLGLSGARADLMLEGGDAQHVDCVGGESLTLGDDSSSVLAAVDPFDGISLSGNVLGQDASITAIYGDVIGERLFGCDARSVKDCAASLGMGPNGGANAQYRLFGLNIPDTTLVDTPVGGHLHICGLRANDPYEVIVDVSGIAAPTVMSGDPIYGDLTHNRWNVLWGQHHRIP